MREYGEGRRQLTDAESSLITGWRSMSRRIGVEVVDVHTCFLGGLALCSSLSHASLHLLDGLLVLRPLVRLALLPSIAHASFTLSLSLKEGMSDACSVSRQELRRETLHAEDLRVNALTIRQGIIDFGDFNLVHLTRVYTKTVGCAQLLAAVHASEVLSALMLVQVLEVVEVTLAVVAPRALEQLFKSWTIVMSALALLVLAHVDGVAMYVDVTRLALMDYVI